MNFIPLKNYLDLFVKVFYFCNMAYNRKNYLKRARYIIDIYKAHKQSDVPDSRIVRTVFPKYNIHISYRQWMNIKGMSVPKQEEQLFLF